MKQAWHHFLKFGDFGQQVTLCIKQHLCLLLLLLEPSKHAIVSQAVLKASPGLHTRHYLPFQSYGVRSSSVAEANA